MAIAAKAVPYQRLAAVVTGEPGHRRRARGNALGEVIAELVFEAEQKPPSSHDDGRVSSKPAAASSRCHSPVTSQEIVRSLADFGVDRLALA